MRRTLATLCQFLCAVGVNAVLGQGAAAQVATLGKGHTILLNNGLQIWGLDQGASGFNYNNLANANFNGVLWSWGADPGNAKLNSLSPGQKWGKWVDYQGNPALALTPVETAKKADLIAIQVGDEQQGDMENPNGVTKAWFQAAHAGNYFPNQLLFTNSFFINSDAAYATFIAEANPDAISFDSYPFNDPYGKLILPHNWLALAGRFRRHALSSYIGTGGNAPRPYGLYLQTYQSTSEGARHPGEVEMRWQQFTAWTMGYTFVDAFTVGGASSLFNGGNMSSPSQPRYDQFAESARQSQNLGPALVRLISYGYGPSIVVGRNAAGTPNLVPADWLVFNQGDAPPNQQYLTSVSATNIGTKNNGQPGDVYIGFFNPLHADFGNPAGTVYFMVTNGLGAYLDDATATVSDCMQRITLSFDFGYETINSLQRLRRNDGQVETIPLTHVSGSRYQLVFDLEGGTGDLFKFNDGHVFVGVQEVMPAVYWDSDANAANNNLNTGAGLGGGGNWDAISNKWYDGSSNTAWVANRNPVFWGTAGTVNAVSPQSVDSLTFKTNGYVLNGASVTLNRPFVAVDGGVTATISSTIAGSTGLTKSGAGTLRLTGSNTYSGGTTINEGVVQVSSDAALGAVPATLRPNISLNGGTLQWGANFDLNNNRAIGLGPDGGTIDTNGFSNPSGYNASAGGFRGPGDLTKVGEGTFFAAAPTGGANTSWTGRLIIKEGTWRIVATDGLPYNPPVADGLQADQVTLDGGTWQIAASINATNGRRGVTIAAGGGTIDTQHFNLTWAGPWAGSVASAVLNKIGSGTLRLNSNATFGPGSYAGILNVNQGTLQLDGGTAMGNLASINLTNAAGVAMSITGGVGETIGSLSGGGASGGNVALSAALTTGDNNNSTTFSGRISGGGRLTKTGTGTFTLAPQSGGNTYTGGTVILGGTLLVNNATGSGTGAGSVTVGPAGTLGGNGTIQGSVTSSGTLAPGSSVGTLNVGGSYAQQSPGRLEIELASTSTFDRLAVNGNATLAGVLSVSLVAGFMPVAGDAFEILTAASVGGTFDGAELPALAGGLSWNINYGANSVLLAVTAVLPGDFNGDGVVDAADYVLWRKTGGTQDDYAAWRANFGQAGSGTGGVAKNLPAVPEPHSTSLMLAGVAIGWFVWSARQRCDCRCIWPRP